MSKQSKKENQKSGSKIDIIGGLLGSINLKLPNIKHKSNPKKDVIVSSNKNYRCEVWDCEISGLMLLVGNVATNLWRARKRNIEELNGIPDELKKTLRHYGASWDLLINAGFEIRDHTNEAYPEGSTLKVIAFQPMAGYGSLTVAETIKPTVYFKDKKIQEGEVIVAMPIKDDTTEKNKD